MFNAAMEQGYLDAIDGVTCCRYGVKESVDAWHKGYDKAEKEGKAKLTRFRDLKRKRR